MGRRASPAERHRESPLVSRRAPGLSAGGEGSSVLRRQLFGEFAAVLEGLPSRPGSRRCDVRLNVGIRRRWFLRLGTALLLGGSITSPTAAVVSAARVAPSASGATRGGGAVPVGRADVRRVVAAATSSACGRSRLPCRLVSMVRDRVGGGLIEDTFTLQVGAGPHDRFRLHHIARAGERRAAKRAVFLVHGDVWGFDAV